MTNPRMTPLLPLQRRQWLALAASCAATLATQPAAWAASTRRGPATRLAAAWESAAGYQVGVLALQGIDQPSLNISAAIDLPTRAHGLLLEPGGTLLAVARRPGDWLLRWRPDGTAPAWSWVEPGRALNGHVIHSADGRTLYTTETDLETGAGLIGLRNAATLEKTGEWSTNGMDPHELLLDNDGSLIVANGGIPSRIETGRAKTQLQRMDPSLVRLDTRSGELRGQWRLADPRLSIRHIAWGAAPASAKGAPRLLGIALQAEHDDLAAKAAAPVLAVFDGQTLQPWTTGTETGAGKSLLGYAGDIAPLAGGFGGGFAVSCPRANGVALWRADGQWTGFLPLDEACALASDAGNSNIKAGPGKQAPDLLANLFVGGRLNALRHDPAGGTVAMALQGVRLDNHWIALG